MGAASLTVESKAAREVYNFFLKLGRRRGWGGGWVGGGGSAKKMITVWW